ncbi:ESX secretion-associated protein EspG [Amycolatopsis sp. NPDC059020]|uniref:ESX secretion-associated protein EspG n=1 Tax=Amycolatopsis sp. NPDC059020 TaxID=3346703 RepID=UPI00366CA7FD
MGGGGGVFVLPARPAPPRAPPPPVVSWFDTGAGRYGATVQDVAGTRWVTVTPANGHWLVNRVEELLHRVGETGTPGTSGASEDYESSTWSVFEKGER